MQKEREINYIMLNAKDIVGAPGISHPTARGNWHPPALSFKRRHANNSTKGDI